MADGLPIHDPADIDRDVPKGDIHRGPHDAGPLGVYQLPARAFGPPILYGYLLNADPPQIAPTNA
jgi:hypothetical protein